MPRPWITPRAGQAPSQAPDARLSRPTLRWLTAALLLVAGAYAIAEDLSVATYYPSPRGAYRALRIGNATAAAPILSVQGPSGTNSVMLPSRAIDVAEIGGGASGGRMLLAQAAGASSWVSMSGDGTLSGAGALSLKLDANDDGQVTMGTETIGNYVSQIREGGNLNVLINPGPPAAADCRREACDTAIGLNTNLNNIVSVNNVGGPFSVNATSETFAGRLAVNLAVVPAAELDVNGRVMIRGGNPATDRVLTATNNSGYARWEPLPGADFNRVGCFWTGSKAWTDNSPSICPVGQYLAGWRQQSGGLCPFGDPGGDADCYSVQCCSP